MCDVIKPALITSVSSHTHTHTEPGRNWQINYISGRCTQLKCHTSCTGSSNLRLIRNYFLWANSAELRSSFSKKAVLSSSVEVEFWSNCAGTEKADSRHVGTTVGHEGNHSPLWLETFSWKGELTWGKHHRNSIFSLLPHKSRFSLFPHQSNTWMWNWRQSKPLVEAQHMCRLEFHTNEWCISHSCWLNYTTGGVNADLENKGAYQRRSRAKSNSRVK